MITSRTIKISVLLLITLLIIPISFYLITFYEYPISNSPKDWSEFATYFGGIINPIIAILGTIILGYLSIQVGRYSSQENKNLFILEQKILAYQKLAKNLEIIENQMLKTVDFLLINDAFKKKMKPEDSLNTNIATLKDLFLPISELQSTLNNFPLMYGHLFKYDFEDESYSKLVSRCEKFIEQSKYPLKELSNTNGNQIERDKDLQKKFLMDFKNLLASLKEELS